MKTLVLTPIAIGVGFGISFGLTALWGATTELGKQWLREIASRLGSMFERQGFEATLVHELQWSGNQSNRDRVSYFMKPLFNDARSGRVTMLVRYPAGEMNPQHTHPVGHGMYVLRGTLVTHRGSFGPDTFVWFPPHEAMTHGAGPDEDLVALFMTSRNLKTSYVRDKA